MERKNQCLIDLIKREMHYLSQVHYVTTDEIGVRYYCEWLTLDCSGIHDIMRKLPFCKVRIVDGLLTFDLDFYGGTDRL